MNLISLLLILMSLNTFALTQDEEKKYDELEGLDFIQALIQDKKYEDVLKYYPKMQVSNKQKLYYYAAEANFQLKRFQAAFDILNKGHQKDESNYLKLWGRTAFHLKKYDRCSEFYSKSKIQNIHGEDWSLYFQCLKKNEELEEALNLALNHQTSDFDFQLMSQRFLIQASLFLPAEQKRVSLLSICLGPEKYLSIGDTLEQVKLKDMLVLEMAHACHPEAIELTSLLIKNLFAEGKFHSIAFIFETLSAQNVAYIKHSAEFYKVAGRTAVADYFFTLGDESDYVLNQSSHYLNQENYAGLLTIPFRAEQLSSNKDLAYALAYSQFKYLSLEASHNTLKGIPKRGGRDEQLIGLIDECRNQDWKCRP